MHQVGLPSKFSAKRCGFRFCRWPLFTFFIARKNAPGISSAKNWSPSLRIVDIQKVRSDISQGLENNQGWLRVPVSLSRVI
jgi:hypothetical protein